MVELISLIAANEIRGRGLHLGDLDRDLLGRFRGLGRQRLDLGRDHRKAAAGLAGARRLDGGVQRQQVGLLGDVGDQLDDVADAGGGFRQRRDARIGLLGLAHRVARDLARLAHLAADVRHRVRKIARRVGGRVDVPRRVARGARHDVGELLGRDPRCLSWCWPRPRGPSIPATRSSRCCRSRPRSCRRCARIDLRCSSAAARRCASSSAACSRARSIARTLNCSTAFAIAPTSSLRCRPGSTTSKWPPARPSIAVTSLRERLRHAADRPVGQQRKQDAGDDRAEHDQMADLLAVRDLRIDRRSRSSSTPRTSPSFQSCFGEVGSELWQLTQDCADMVSATPSAHDTPGRSAPSRARTRPSDWRPG